jgi:hypothetical protein
LGALSGQRLSIGQERHRSPSTTIRPVIAAQYAMLYRALSRRTLALELVGKMLVKAYEKGEINDNQRELWRAFTLGASF